MSKPLSSFGTPTATTAEAPAADTETPKAVAEPTSTETPTPVVDPTAGTGDDGPTPVLDELALLKTRADKMGVTYSSRIGIDALKAKIDDFLAGKTASETDEAGGEDTKTDEAETAPVLTQAERVSAARIATRKENLRLIRLRITNLNPNKKDLPGEIFTVANKYLGNIRKYVPYGEVTDNGYHVPNVIYKQLLRRKFQHITTKRNRTTGQIDVSQRWASEFALEVLPQLTKEELKDLANQQAMSGSVD